MNAEKAKPPYDLGDINNACIHAGHTSKAMYAAYWSDERRAYLVEKAHWHFANLAWVMGYTITKKGGGE